MPKPVKGRRLGSGPSHQKLMLSGLATALFREERIRTTQTKAKRLRPVAERLITWGKAGTIHARRQALSVIEDRDVVHKLFAEIAPRYPDRNGGYTRILKLGPRKGDAAPMVVIELVEGGEAPPVTTPAPEVSGRRRRVLGRRRGSAETPQTRESRRDTPVPPHETAETDETEEETGEEAPEPREAEEASVAQAESEAAEQMEAEATQAIEAGAEAKGEEPEPPAKEPPQESTESDESPGKANESKS